jgi:hypothetical protein
MSVWPSAKRNTEKKRTSVGISDSVKICSAADLVCTYVNMLSASSCDTSDSSRLTREPISMPVFEPRGRGMPLVICSLRFCASRCAEAAAEAADALAAAAIELRLFFPPPTPAIITAASDLRSACAISLETACETSSSCSSYSEIELRCDMARRFERPRLAGRGLERTLEARRDQMTKLFHKAPTFTVLERKIPHSTTGFFFQGSILFLVTLTTSHRRWVRGKQGGLVGGASRHVLIGCTV